MSLVAHNQDVGLGAPQIFLQVVENPAGVAHACARQNGARATHSVQLPGIVNRSTSFEVLRIQRQKASPRPFGQFLIKQFWMLDENPARVNRHRAVQINGKGLHFLLPEQNGQVIENLLRPADGKRRYQNLSIVSGNPLNDLLELSNGFGVWPMFSVPVSGLQKYQVSLLQQIELPNDGQGLRAKIPGEDDDFPVASSSTVSSMPPNPACGRPPPSAP